MPMTTLHRRVATILLLTLGPVGQCLAQEYEVVLPTQHLYTVSAAAFSPDGRFIATGGGRDYMVVLRDADTGRPLRIFEGHRGEIVSVQFTRDGKQLLAVAMNGKVLLWNVANGELLQEFGPSIYLNSANVLQDGNRLLTNPANSRPAVLWDLRTGKKLREFKTREARWSAAVSPGSEHVAFGGENFLELWAVDGDMPLQVLEELNSPVAKIAFSPNGKLIAAGHFEGGMSIWDVESGELVRRFGERMTRSIGNIEFTPDGKTLLTASSDTVNLWDVATGKQIQSFDDHTWFVSAAVFSPDGKQLLSGSAEGTAVLWDIESGERIRTLCANPLGNIPAVAWSADGDQVASTTQAEGVVKTWDFRSGRPLLTFVEHSAAVRDLEFSPDNRFLLTCSDDSKALLWDAKTGELVRKFECDSPIIDISFSPDGRRLVCTTGEPLERPLRPNHDPYAATVREVASGDVVMTIKPETEMDLISSAQFSPDGEHILTGGFGRAVLWDASNGKRIRDYEEAALPQNSLFFLFAARFSADGRRIFGGGSEGTLTSWGTRSGERLKTLRAGGLVYDFAATRNGSEVVVAAEEARLLDVATGKALCDFNVGTLSLALSPDEKRVLVDTTNGDLVVLDKQTTTRLRTFRAFFNTDETYTIFHDPESGDEIGKMLTLGSPADWIFLTPDGRYDCSPKTDQRFLVRKPGTLDFVPLERFRAKYYQPGLLEEVVGPASPDNDRESPVAASVH